MNFLLGWGDEILLATTMTIRIAVGALVLGLLWGNIGAFMKLSRYRILRLIADFYTTMSRSIPELLLVLIVYFGSTITLTNLWKLWNPKVTYVDVSPFAAGIFTLSLVFGGYATEVFRGAIEAIPRGQIEAARAVGMSSWLIFRRITLPQMLRFALPGLGNLWISLVKNTSLISVIGLEEIMRVSAIATNRTHQPFRFYIAAIVIYLVLAIINTQILQRLEVRASRGVRKVV